MLPVNISMVWGDPDTAPYSVYQHITYLWEEPHQDGKHVVFTRSTDFVMSFNCIRKPHFEASHKSHDFVGFHLDRAQPACCSSLSWAPVVKYQPANDSASGVSWMPDKGSGGRLDRVALFVHQVNHAVGSQMLQDRALVDKHP